MCSESVCNAYNVPQSLHFEGAEIQGSVAPAGNEGSIED